MEMEDCWEFRLGLSLWVRRLSLIIRLKELSVLLIIEKSSTVPKINITKINLNHENLRMNNINVLWTLRRRPHSNCYTEAAVSIFNYKMHYTSLL